MTQYSQLWCQEIKASTHCVIHIGHKINPFKHDRSNGAQASRILVLNLTQTNDPEHQILIVGFQTDLHLTLQVTSFMICLKFCRFIHLVACVLFNDWQPTSYAISFFVLLSWYLPNIADRVRIIFVRAFTVQVRGISSSRGARVFMARLWNLHNVWTVLHHPNDILVHFTLDSSVSGTCFVHIKLILVDSC